MNTKKLLLMAGIVSSIGTAGLAGHHLVVAESSTSGSNTLVTKIAQKFNLNTTDVQEVFDEDRTDRQAERQTEIEKNLAQAVSDGKLTAEQKDKIIAKQKELQSGHEAEFESMKNKTEAERKAAMEAKRTELEKWAGENNIPTQYLRYIMGHGGHGPHGSRHM
jgi:hypothetical protein